MPIDEIPETGIARKNCHPVNSLGFQHRTHAGNGMILFIDFGKLMGFRAGDILDKIQYLFFCSFSACQKLQPEGILFMP